MKFTHESLHNLQEENKNAPIDKSKHVRPQEIKLPGETVVVGLVPYLTP